MSDSKPSLLPGSLPAAAKTKTAASAPSAPSALPPGAVSSTAGKCGGGGSVAQAAAPAIGNASLQAPSRRPGATKAAGGVTATWQSNVHVIGMWSINQDRNCWAYLDNVGWRNLSGASESGLVAMNMLASHAYQLGSSTSLYEEDDGRISQLYVW